VNVLRGMRGDRTPAVRIQVAEAMWRLGYRDALPDLIGFTVSSHPDDQMLSLLALAAPRDASVIEHVRGGLTSDYKEVALVAARAMGMLGSDEGYGVAASAVKSPDARQRLLAALAFGAVGRTDAQPYLAALLKDSDPDVRLGAASSIFQLR
jgi:HEAT repeat protein